MKQKTKRPNSTRLTRPARLTARERELLTLALHGLPTAEIAQRFNVTERTITRQLAIARRKIGLGGR